MQRSALKQHKLQPQKWPERPETFFLNCVEKLYSKSSTGGEELSTYHQLRTHISWNVLVYRWPTAAMFVKYKYVSGTSTKPFKTASELVWISPALFVCAMWFWNYRYFSGNNSWIFVKNIRSIRRLVALSEYKRGLLGLGGGKRSTEWRASLKM